MARALYYLKVIFFALLIMQIGSQVFYTIKKNIENRIDPKNKVALILLNQVILNAAGINTRLQQAFKDDEIKAVLLKIESPGGAAGASEAISQEIMYLKQKYPKPIVAYVENVAASGGYQIASATDYIVATSNALIGSIGAKLATQVKVKEFLQQYKIQTYDFASSPYKNAGDPLSDTNPEQEAMLKDVVAQAALQFSTEVATLRHLDMADEKMWGQGKVFTGSQALRLKLIDALGNQRVALDYIKKQILHADYEIELVPFKARSSWKRFFDEACDGDEDDVQTSIAHSFWKSLFVCIRQNSMHIS